MENKTIRKPEMPGWMPDAVRLYTDNAPDAMKPVVAAVVNTLWGTLACNAVAQHPLFNKTEYTTQLTAIWAGAGDGKSFMDAIAEEILQPLRSIDERNQRKYEIELREYKATPQAKRMGEPVAPVLRVPETSITRPALLEQQKLAEQVSQIIWTSEIEEMLERGRFNAIRDIVRKSFDGALAGQRVKSTDSFNGSAHIHLSLLVAGTPNQLLKMIGNFEDGLSTRFNPVRLPEGWVSDMTIQTLSDKQQSRLREFQDTYIRQTYIRTEDGDYQPKERTMYDIRFFYPYAHAWDQWLKEQWEETGDPLYKSLGGRALEMGLRAMLTYLPLYPDYLKNQKRQAQLAEYAMWQTRWAFYNLFTTFGSEIRKVSEAQSVLTAPVSIQPSVYMLLGDEFTTKDVEDALHRQGRKTVARNVITKWKQNSLVEKLSPKKYRKLVIV